MRFQLNYPIRFASFYGFWSHCAAHSRNKTAVNNETKVSGSEADLGGGRRRRRRRRQPQGNLCAGVD